MGGEQEDRVGEFSENEIEERIFKILQNWETEEALHNFAHPLQSETEKSKKTKSIKETGVLKLKKPNKTLSSIQNFFSKAAEFTTGGPLQVLYSVLSSWGAGDLFFGLQYYFSMQHNPQYKKKIIEMNKVFVSDSINSFYSMKEIFDVLYIARLLRNGFKNFDKDNINKFVLENSENILHYDLYDKGFMLFLDEKKKKLMLMMRGTKYHKVDDVLVDLKINFVEFPAKGSGHFVHDGVLKTANWFFNNKFLKDLMNETLKQRPEYSLEIVGHSIGGACAALLGVLLLKEFPRLRVITFGCPQVFSYWLAKKYENLITTYVFNDDFVPYISKYTLWKLRKSVSVFDWREKLEKDIKRNSGRSMLYKIAGGVYKNLTKKNKKPLKYKPSKLIPLYPPGRIVNFRVIEKKVYVKLMDRDEFQEIRAISMQGKKDHSIKETKKILKEFLKQKGYKFPIKQKKKLEKK